MATKATTSTVGVSPIYHDFEPFYEWKRGEDLLIVHVPEFKKEHLRVQVNTSGALKIKGERPLGGDKAVMRSRFYKETRVPEGCNLTNIQAKLSDGKLTIIMPRKSPSSSSMDPSTQTPTHEDISREDQRVSIPKKPRTSTPDQRESGCSVLETMLGKCGFVEEEEDMIRFGRFKVSKTTAVGVGVAMVAIAAIGALAVFKPETSAPSSSASFAT